MKSVSRAFLEKVALYQGILHKICRVYAFTPEDREDLFQDMLYNAWKSYPLFKEEAKFSTWLYKVALNTALMQRRAERRSIFTQRLEPEHLGVPAEPDDDLTVWLYRAIQSLESLNRSVIILYLDGLSYREIADITGLKESAVGVRITRIKPKLKSILQNYGVR